MKLFDFFSGKSAPLIGQATEHMVSMLSQAHQMFEASTAKLLDNEILDVDLVEADKVINQGEKDIRRLVLEHIAIDPNHELVFGLILLTVVQDAERLGDLAKTIAEVANLSNSRRFGSRVDELRGIRDQVIEMYKDTTQGFSEGSIELSRKVMEMNQSQKPRRESFIRGLAEADDVEVNSAVVLALGCRLISRTASHLSNISSGVAAPFDKIRKELDGE